jgi:hypothetical protein
MLHQQEPEATNRTRKSEECLGISLNLAGVVVSDSGTEEHQTVNAVGCRRFYSKEANREEDLARAIEQLVTSP